MAKPSDLQDKTSRSVVEEVVVKEAPKVYNQFVSIRSMVDATVKVTGAVTKKQYVFAGAGAIQNVDKQDADEILNKKRGRTCCGTATDKSLFELV